VSDAGTGRPIRIAVASGKGGTGKTTIATSLAFALGEAGERVAYVDCDVEEPNGHLFLAPAIRERRAVSIPVPEVDEAKCTYCGACGRACRYSAILILPKTILTFPKLCHGCGGCALACPAGAIREVPRPIGVVEAGDAGAIGFVQGRLDVGEAMAPPVIRAVLAAAPADRALVLDAPPGTSCPVVESVKTADAVLLVTEPTPFGLNDLKLAVGMVRALGRPFGVAVNRAGIGDDRVLEYCAQERIPVLLELPNDREIAEAYSRGELAARSIPRLRRPLLEAYRRLAALAEDGVEAGAVPEPTRDRPAPATGAGTPRPSERFGAGGPPGLPELVVISGKGGTGKTSVTASFAALAERAAAADCDVDAADLHLVLRPSVRERGPFSGGRKAVVDPARCTGCGTCAPLCRFGAIRGEAGRPHAADAIGCEGCGVCADHCPEGAIDLVAAVNGEWLASATPHGPLAHARLGIAEENSGKLVALVRTEGRAIAAEGGRDLVICDGSPGIGCPVISSLTGARFALVVTEPTVSGLHDFERVAALARQLGVRCGVCVNKADLNPEQCARIEARAAAAGVAVLGRIRYDDAITAAQVAGVAVVEIEGSAAAGEIRALWERVQDAIS
jgi:MinD superfamily P-loop ATPase